MQVREAAKLKVIPAFSIIPCRAHPTKLSQFRFINLIRISTRNSEYDISRSPFLTAGSAVTGQLFPPLPEDAGRRIGVREARKLNVTRINKTIRFVCAASASLALAHAAALDHALDLPYLHLDPRDGVVGVLVDVVDAHEPLLDQAESAVHLHLGTAVGFAQDLHGTASRLLQVRHKPSDLPVDLVQVERAHLGLDLLHRAVHPPRVLLELLHDRLHVLLFGFELLHHRLHLSLLVRHSLDDRLQSLLAPLEISCRLGSRAAHHLADEAA